MSAITLAIADVNQAFAQLEFAIKLMCYCELGHLDKEKFDTDVLILLAEENISFPAGLFASYQSIVTAAQLNVGICFGVSAIVLDAAFTQARLAPKPELSTPDNEVRTLVYMVRSAFAHNIAYPRREARGPFARTITLNIGGSTLPIDMAELNETGFDYLHIGGFAMWFKIKDIALEIIHGI